MPECIRQGLCRRFAPPNGISGINLDPAFYHAGVPVVIRIAHCPPVSSPETCPMPVQPRGTELEAGDLMVK